LLTIQHSGFECLEYLRERIEVRVTVAERSKRQALLQIDIGGEDPFAASPVLGLDTKSSNIGVGG